MMLQVIDFGQITWLRRMVNCMRQARTKSVIKKALHESTTFLRLLRLSLIRLLRIELLGSIFKMR